MIETIWRPSSSHVRRKAQAENIKHFILSVVAISLSIELETSLRNMLVLVFDIGNLDVRLLEQ